MSRQIQRRVGHENKQYIVGHFVSNILFDLVCREKNSCLNFDMILNGKQDR